MTTKGYVFHRDPNRFDRPTGWRIQIDGGEIPTLTLASLRKTVDSLITEHGEEATFELYAEADGYEVPAQYRLERAATEAEVEARKAKDAAEKEAQVRAQRETYERLKAIFEPSPAITVDATAVNAIALTATFSATEGDCSIVVLPRGAKGA